MSSSPLRVLQVNSTDLVGTRFNNHAVAPRLAEHGIVSQMLVWDRLGEDADVAEFLPARWVRRVNRWLGRVEQANSIHARLQLQAFLLAAHPFFRAADVVHYHLIHDGWFSLDALPFLARRKPSVWTWHDPWPMTGHCIYPMGCERWRIGCGACPDLALPFAMRRDRTASQHAWKRGLLQRTDVELVVASEAMMEMARASPIAQGHPLHLLPFGVDLSTFRPPSPAEVEAARRRLGIRPDRVVIGFRAAPENVFKGSAELMAALRLLPRELPHKLCLLSTQGGQQCLPMVERHQVVELGWVDDPQVMLDTYHAADFFVMPSRAEAFGMMAVEAMACGKPVIVAEGTSLPEVVAAPECGLAVPQGDVPALADAITRLVANAPERERRGAAGRALAEERYDERRFAAGLADIYRGARARRAAA